MSNEEAQAILAKANLLRLRGDIAQAEQICMTVMASRPADVIALAMLGDIRFEASRSEEAEHFYDLAVQTGEAPAAVQEKLHELRSRRERRPEVRPSATAPWVVPAIACVGFLSTVAVVAMIAPHFQPKLEAVSVKVIAPKEPEVPKATEPATVHPAPKGALADSVFLQKLNQRTEIEDRIETVELDPRNDSVTLSAQIRATDTPRTVAAMLAYAAFATDLNLKSVSIRLIFEERLVFLGEIARVIYDEATKTPGRAVVVAMENGFTNEWQNDRKNAVRSMTKEHP